MQGGTLRAAPLASAHLLANAGGVDLTGTRTKLVIDHSVGSPVVDHVRNLLAVGFANGFATGQLRSTTATAVRGLGYTDAGTVLTVMATLYGDADLDGGVLINDFNLLAAGFGQSLPASNPMWTGLLAFAAAHNDLAAFEAATGVPEPMTVAPLGFGTLLCARPRRRHRVVR